MNIADRESSMNVKFISNENNSTTGETKVPTFAESAKAMLFTGSLNLLLVCTPIAIISYAADLSDAVTFVFSLLALAPLAERLGYVTEHLAVHTNETIGGLLNATFGNATELIVAITALSKGLYKLVQLSLLGSILSNMLLVMGTAFMLGGWRHKTLQHETISSQVNATLLMLSVMGILFPTILTSTGYESNLGSLGLSRAASIILFLVYFAYLYFQLFTHRHLYEEGEAPAQQTTSTIHGSDVENAASKTHESKEEAGAVSPASAASGAAAEDDEEQFVDELGFNNSLFWLGAITALIAVLSDAISSSIQDAADSADVSGVFIAAILLPIVGNAAEHAGAILFAWKGKVDLTLGVAIGSSTQIALCVLPLLVILGWMMGKDLSLDFGGFEGMTLLLSVISVTFVLKDGETNWLLGTALVAAYLIIAVAFWSHLNEPLDS